MTKMKIQFGSDTNFQHFFSDADDLEYLGEYEMTPGEGLMTVETDQPNDVRELAESYGGDVVEL